MWQPLVNKKINSNQELQEYADQLGKFHEKLYWEMANSSLKKEVERLLREKKEGWLYQLKELLKKKENTAIKNQDEELRLVDWLCICSEKERKARRLSLLYRCESLKQISMVYQITVFYLTRIRLQMEKESYAEFFQFIKEWSLSPEYMAMVIEKGKFGDKASVGKQLLEVLKKNDEEEYGEKVLQELGVWENF